MPPISLSPLPELGFDEADMAEIVAIDDPAARETALASRIESASDAVELGFVRARLELVIESSAAETARFLAKHFFSLFDFRSSLLRRFGESDHSESSLAFDELTELLSVMRQVIRNLSAEGPSVPGPASALPPA